jgi:cytochrome d ubiquinol oxidase subunit II
MVEAWFAIFWLMVAAYVVLDGRTLGAGALRLFIASTSGERRQVLDAIGPIWSLYEVWLVGAGGVLLLAFPSVFAAAFSGYYLALFLILWLLVLRGIAIELGRHLDHPLWRSFWDFVLTASSALLILIFGVALGNIIRGVPLDERAEFHMAFFTDFRPTGHVGLLDWYTLSVGLFALAGLGAHGATFLTSRTTGVIRGRTKAAGRWLWISTLLLGVIVAIETGALRADLLSAMVSRPLSVVFLLLGVAAAVAVLYGHRSDRDGLAFAGSCLLIAAVIGASAAAGFPVFLQSTLDPQQSLSARQAAASHHSLVIALLWWLIAAPLALTWHVLANHSFRGRIAPAYSVDEARRGNQ